MDRRTFMKLMGGLAAMPIVGRIAKPLKSETVQEGIASLSGKGMELYEMVIAKVMKEGKKNGESGRVDSYKHPDRPDITVDVNQTDGSAEIYFDTDKGSKGYAKIDRDMETGGTDLQEAEEIYKGTPEGDYYKDVEEGISGGLENLDEFTRIKKNIGGPVQPYDPRASTADFARAIDRVGAGTNMQKAMDIQRYDQNVQRQNMVNRIQKMNPAGTGNFLQGIKDFGQHAMVSEAMAGKTGKSVIPQYGFQTGYDFQKKFTGLDPKISAGLAAAYQTLQEGSRALNPFGDTFLRFPTAMKTATQQATENMEGILAADTGTITPEQQAARNEYLESQGQPTEPLIDQDRSSEIVEQQKAAGVPDEGLITNFDPNLTPQDAAEISKKMADDGSSTIPGFTRLKNPDGAPGNYNEFMYEGPDGQIYGAGTYGSIAAGMYPSIYDPNRPTMGRPSQYPASRYTEINGTYYDKTDPQDAAEIAKKISFGEIPNLIDRPNTNLASGGRVGYEQGGLANLLGV